MVRIAFLVLFPLALGGCDQLSERAGFPDPAKQEAEGKAIGGACRHAGRGLEDCYRLNKSATKAAIYAGWKEMNEYMAKNNMQTVEPSEAPPTSPSKEAEPEKGAEEKSDAGTKSAKNGTADDKPASSREAAH